MPLLTLFGLLLVFAMWVLSEPLRTERRRRRIRSRPFPAEWRAILQRRVPYFRLLPVDLQLQLKKHIQVFVAEKAFIGCRGLEVTDEVRITIAAQACLLLLNGKATYYPRLQQILVYPAAFMVHRVQTDGAGLSQEQPQVLLGESWVQGQVILSWEDSLEGAAVVDDGRNVVIHEFAHQLDQEKGHANGAPPLAGRQRRARWARVLNEAFEQLQQQVRAGEASLLSPYGATDPAEFFAVASEVFFEQPQQLAQEHAALFDELSTLYRINPLSW